MCNASHCITLVCMLVHMLLKALPSPRVSAAASLPYQLEHPSVCVATHYLLPHCLTLSAFLWGKSGVAMKGGEVQSTKHTPWTW